MRHGHAADDIVRAVNAIFTALEKRVRESRRVRAGQEVKHHPTILHGVIVELEPELGYGFLRADNGQEVFFQRDGLVTGTWEDLALGARLRFREQMGKRAPSPWTWHPPRNGRAPERSANRKPIAHFANTGCRPDRLFSNSAFCQAVDLALQRDGTIRHFDSDILYI